MPVLVLAGIVWYLHHTSLTEAWLTTPWLVVLWGSTLGMAYLQLLLSWSQRAVTTRPGSNEDRYLSRLRTTVVIPCYNEDAAIVDRVLYAISRQTRLPDRVIVVDDASSLVNYHETDLITYWSANMPCDFVWLVHERNQGKKHAQATGFNYDPECDIFITIDSDSALVRNAIEEGLKPFKKRDVVSVAGLESAINFGRNILTRGVCFRSLCFQLYAMSAQSQAHGNTLINPGAYSLYRAWLIRKVLPAYLGETFLGLPVTLGDDTALTTFALAFGRAIHQPSAVALNVYPETLQQHLKQWIRWMRASSIRTLWRIRYLPMTSWGWIYVVYSTWGFLNSVAVSVLVLAAWPASWRLGVAVLIASLAWPWLLAFRLSTIRRSDMRWHDVIRGLLLLPVAAVWFLLVLRQIRFYGMATCWRQSWVTRQSKVEVSLEPEKVSA